MRAASPPFAAVARNPRRSDRSPRFRIGPKPGREDALYGDIATPSGRTRPPDRSGALRRSYTARVGTPLLERRSDDADRGRARSTSMRLAPVRGRMDTPLPEEAEDAGDGRRNGDPGTDDPLDAPQLKGGELRAELSGVRSRRLPDVLDVGADAGDVGAGRLARRLSCECAGTRRSGRGRSGCSRSSRTDTRDSTSCSGGAQGELFGQNERSASTRAARTGCSVRGRGRRSGAGRRRGCKVARQAPSAASAAQQASPTGAAASPPASAEFELVFWQSNREQPESGGVRGGPPRSAVASTGGPVNAACRERCTSSRTFGAPLDVVVDVDYLEGLALPAERGR